MAKQTHKSPSDAMVTIKCLPIPLPTSPNGQGFEARVYIAGILLDTVQHATRKGALDAVAAAANTYLEASE